MKLRSMGNGGIAPCIFNPDTIWRKFTHRPFKFLGNSHQCCL